MRKLIFISLIVFGIITTVNASSVVDLTEIGVGARPLGMGKAFNSIVDDSSAIFMNPAGLTATEKFSLLSMSGNLINEIPYLILGGSWKSPYGYWGIGYITSSTGGIREAILVGVTPEVTGNEADYGASTIILSYANNAKDIEYINRVAFLTDRDAAVGANLKFANHGFSGAPSFEGSATGGFDLDVGTIIPINEQTTGSFTIKNIIPGNNIGADEMPMAIIGGVAYEIPDRNLVTAADAEFSNRGFLLHLGTEWNPTEPLFLRGGFDQAANGFNLALGIGTKYRGFTFDYAYHTYAELSEFTTHYFSLGYSQ